MSFMIPGMAQLAGKLIKGGAQAQPQQNYAPTPMPGAGGAPGEADGMPMGEQMPPIFSRMARGARGNLDTKGTSNFGEQARNALYGALGAI